MARIRTVKPEFWDSPSTAKAGPWARLLYIAMWNWADDYGRGTANLKELEGFAFPNDTFPAPGSGNTVQSHGNTVQFRDVVAEVAECYGVVFYEVDGRPYFAITTWEKHQRNERRSAESKHPAPPAPTSEDTRESGNTVQPHGNTEQEHGVSGPGTGEQGNRGTGEQGRKTAARSARSSTSPPATPPGFDAFWDAYPRKVAKPKARNAYAATVKAGANPDDILAGLNAQLPALQRTEAKFIPHPTTWLNQERWNDPPPEPPDNRSRGQRERDRLAQVWQARSAAEHAAADQLMPEIGA